MTKQDFIQYLSSPEKLNSHSIDALEKLVLEYPYFQIGRMLYLKNLHNQNSIDYEKNLCITFAHTPGGKILYTLIKKKTDGPAGMQVSAPFQNVNENQEPIVNLKPKTSNIILPHLEPVVLLSEIPVNIRASTPAEKNNAPAEKQNEPDEMQLLEKQIKEEAIISASFQSGVMGWEPEEKTPHATPQTTNKVYSFNDWLRMVSGKTLQGTKAEKTFTNKQKAEIVERFFLEETARSVPKQKSEFYSADTMAKKSLQDNETFITETLAKIYLQQGNLQKAIRAYEILMVKHPEKIHKFAPLLEKIKKLLEQQKGR